MSKSKLPSHVDLEHLKGIDWSELNLIDETCEDCEEQFTTKAKLLAHVPCFKQQHPDRLSSSGKYQCLYCVHESCHVWDIASHIAAIHLKEFPFRCNHCGSRFSKKSQVFGHMRSHHYSFKCDFPGCREVFYSVPDFNRHKATVHGDRSALVEALIKSDGSNGRSK